MDVEIISYQFKNMVDDLVVIDIHRYTLYEVKTDLPHLMIEYLSMGYQDFQIIHGYHGGQILKNYIRNSLQSVLLQMNKSIVRTRTWKEGEGDTFIVIDLN